MPQVRSTRPLAGALWAPILDQPIPLAILLLTLDVAGVDLILYRESLASLGGDV